MNYQPRVFVIMPFGAKPVPSKSAPGNRKSGATVEADFNLTYDALLKPAIENAGCEPFRADQEPGAGDIRIDMFFELVTADIVLADISALNANVFYELGIRHGVAPNGVFVVHGRWGFARPFDIAPDRAFDYDGELFRTNALHNTAWRRKLAVAVESLSAQLIKALKHDRETVGSPVYAHLPGLKPVNWEGLHNARAKYFGGLLTDWRQRIRLAQATGHPGDILTLAEDAPTRQHREKLLYAAARGLIDLGRFDIAKDVLEDLVRFSPDYLEAQCQLGLVLGRLGQVDAAVQRMENLARLHQHDPEIQGILARIYKDMWRLVWEKTGDPMARRSLAAAQSARVLAAIRSYYSALERHPDSYYDGINVLTLAALLKHLAKETGRQARLPSEIDLPTLNAVVRFAAEAACRRAIQANDQEGQVWSTATLGELAVVDEDASKAQEMYAEACGFPGATPFQKRSMLDQLELLQKLDFNPPAVSAAITGIQSTFANFDAAVRPRFGKVFVFSGHMIDKPDRPLPRFPAVKEAAVRDSLEAVLHEWDVGPGDLAISGGARGGDILFAEICRSRGAHVRLLLPKREEEFVEESVRIPRTTWQKRFYDLTGTCEHWFQNEHLGLPPEGASVHVRNNLWILNTGRAEATSGQLYGALVWDEKATGDGVGGTSHFASEVRRFKGQVEIVNPTKL